MLEVDRFGLDEIDQKIMRTVLEKFGGGPVGVNTIAASIGEESETIEEVYEPYLIQLGFLHRSPRGRIATERAYDYFKVPAPFRRRGAAAGAVLKNGLSGAGLERGRSRTITCGGAGQLARRRDLRLQRASRACMKPSPWGCANSPGF